MREPKSTYPFEWLELIITVTLNPLKTDIRRITDNQYVILKNLIPEECDRLHDFIKRKVFSIQDEQDIIFLVRKYHTELVRLSDKISENKKKLRNSGKDLKQVADLIFVHVNELLLFIESDYEFYFSANEKISITYLTFIRKEFESRLNHLNKYLKGCDPAIDIVIKRLDYLVHSVDLKHKLTYRDIFYKRELLTKLISIHPEADAMGIFSPVDELLIYLNYNSKAYINLLINKITASVQFLQDPIDKTDRLLLCYKTFSQMHRKPGAILNPGYYDLETVFGNWFAYEILYLKQKNRHEPAAARNNQLDNLDSLDSHNKVVKLTSNLTSDQLGLILRAADETKLIIAKSLNHLFHTIVPYLSTFRKQELSPDGMRSKTYAAEERDKQKVIDSLRKMIEKVSEF